MPSIEPYTGSPSSCEARHPRGEEGERLLHLRAGEVRAQAVVHAGAEGQRLGAGAVGGDVEAGGRVLAVAGEGAHEHDRALGEVDVAVADVLHRDPGGERGDRLEAHDLLDRGGREQRVLGQQRPLVRVLGEQPQRVRELALGRVDAADEHVEHEVERLDVREPVALLLGGDQRGDQVVAGLGAAAAEQLAGVGVELDDGLLDLRALGRRRSSRTGAGSSVDQSHSRPASSIGAPITVAITCEG